MSILFWYNFNEEQEGKRLVLLIKQKNSLLRVYGITGIYLKSRQNFIS